MGRAEIGNARITAFTCSRRCVSLGSARKLRKACSWQRLEGVLYNKIMATSSNLAELSKSSFGFPRYPEVPDCPSGKVMTDRYAKVFVDPGS